MKDITNYIILLPSEVPTGQPCILHVGNDMHPQCVGRIVAYGDKNGDWAWIKKGWTPPQKRG